LCAASGRKEGEKNKSCETHKAILIEMVRIERHGRHDLVGRSAQKEMVGTGHFAFTG
jgi:hypothetical protein